MATDVVELFKSDDVVPVETANTYEALWCYISGSQTTRCLVGVHDQP
jgi:hypothetical protein